MENGKSTAPELAEKLEVSVRTIYRDIDIISSAGVPIYVTTGRNGGIQIADSFVLDRLLLSDKEKEDMAHLLIDTLKEGRRYSIVSAGTYANRIILLMKYMNIEAAAVYDNSDDKVGKIFNGYTIELMDNICNNDRDDIYIIANKNHSDELKKQLEILGIKKDNIKIFDNLYDWTRLIDIYNHIEST